MGIDFDAHVVVGSAITLKEILDLDLYPDLDLDKSSLPGLYPDRDLKLRIHDKAVLDDELWEDYKLWEHMNYIFVSEGITIGVYGSADYDDIHFIIQSYTQGAGGSDQGTYCELDIPLLNEKIDLFEEFVLKHGLHFTASISVNLTVNEW